MRQYRLHGKPIIKYQSWTCFWYWCWKNLFFNVKLKLLMINFNVSQFHEHIFRSSRSQIFFKIGALKNFAVLKIKKGLQHKYFPVRSSHVMLTYWYISFSKCWDSDFIPLYLFLKNWSIPQHISVRSVRINFSNCNRQN